MWVLEVYLVIFIWAYEVKWCIWRTYAPDNWTVECEKPGICSFFLRAEAEKERFFWPIDWSGVYLFIFSFARQIDPRFFMLNRLTGLGCGGGVKEGRVGRGRWSCSRRRCLKVGKGADFRVGDKLISASSQYFLQKYGGRGDLKVSCKTGEGDK